MRRLTLSILVSILCLLNLTSPSFVSADIGPKKTIEVTLTLDGKEWPEPTSQNPETISYLLPQLVYCEKSDDKNSYAVPVSEQLKVKLPEKKFCNYVYKEMTLKFTENGDITRTYFENASYRWELPKQFFIVLFTHPYNDRSETYTTNISSLFSLTNNLVSSYSFDINTKSNKGQITVSSPDLSYVSSPDEPAAIDIYNSMFEEDPSVGKFPYILFLIALTGTVVIESLVVGIFAFARHIDVKRQVFTITLANLFTLPFLWYTTLSFGANLYIMEIVITSLEFLALKFIGKISYKNAFAIALLANVLSYGLGQLLI